MDEQLTPAQLIDACEREIRDILAKYDCSIICEHIERAGQLVGINIHAVKRPEPTDA